MKTEITSNSAPKTLFAIQHKGYIVEIEEQPTSGGGVIYMAWLSKPGDDRRMPAMRLASPSGPDEFLVGIMKNMDWPVEELEKDYLAAEAAGSGTQNETERPAETAVVLHCQ